MVRIAGLAAREMPKLERMVISKNGERDQAAIIYRRQSHMEATLTIRATWDVQIDPELVKAWEGGLN